MKLWLISQTENDGYDTYDAAVVAAPDEYAAKVMHPSGRDANWNERWPTWAALPDVVTVKYLGEAVTDTPAGVICASFNAG